MSIFLNSKKSLFFILLNFSIFLIIIQTKEQYLTIPFTIIYNKEPEKFSSFDDYYNSWNNLSLYGTISVGTPPQKITTKLTFEDYGVSVINKGCDYFISSTDIDININLQKSSSTFNQTYDYYSGYDTFYYKSETGAYYAKDSFYFDSTSCDGISSETKKIEKLIFIYSPNDNKKTCTCFNIGFRPFCRNFKETSINFINQMKYSGIINNYDWSIIYNENNNEKYPEKGTFLIGIKPHEYNPKLVKEDDLYGSGFISDETMSVFNFKINEIFFESFSNISLSSEKIDITGLTTVQLIPTNGLIKGSQKYEKKLEIYFFNSLISDNKCFKQYKDKDNNQSFRTFVCYNKPEIKKELKEKFPTLKLKQTNFVYTFELTYDDLFREKGDKIYFLVWFNSYVDTSWELGLPFLKKYLFNYNNDKKTVSFYHQTKKEENKNNEQFKKVYLIIIIFASLIIATIFGFVIGILLKKRKKKQKAQELEPDNNNSLFEENENANN